MAENPENKKKNKKKHSEWNADTVGTCTYTYAQYNSIMYFLTFIDWKTFFLLIN